MSRAVDEAAAWLRVVLERGPMPAATVRVHAAARGIASRTLQRASAVAGVIIERRGFSAGSVWRLPSAPEPETRKNLMRGCWSCENLAAAGCCLVGAAAGLAPDELGRCWPPRERFDGGECPAFAPAEAR